MKEVGGFLMLIGIAAAAFAMFGYDPTVGDTSFDRTVNLQLLATQMAMFLAGGFSFVGGTVFYSFGELFERYPRKKEAQSDDKAEISDY